MSAESLWNIHACSKLSRWDTQIATSTQLQPPLVVGVDLAHVGFIYPGIDRIPVEMPNATLATSVSSEIPELSI